MGIPVKTLTSINLAKNIVILCPNLAPSKGTLEEVAKVMLDFGFVIAISNPAQVTVARFDQCHWSYADALKVLAKMNASRKRSSPKSQKFQDACDNMVRLNGNAVVSVRVRIYGGKRVLYNCHHCFAACI